MPRKASPWFRKSDAWWYIKINGKQTKLAKGKANKQAAVDRWHELMTERAANPAADSDDHTVASVIDLYLAHVKRTKAARTYDKCQRYLQRFAESHGWRPVCDCKPIHLTHWLDQHDEWQTDWTLHGIVSVVHRPFNWASHQRLIAANPFQGVSHRPGQPRRPLTDDEFRGLIRATVTITPGQIRRKPRQRPTPGERFRQVLFFLRLTGARPSEMAKLKWADVDLDNAVIVLRQHKTIRTQRTPKPRVIPLVSEVVKILIRIRRRQSVGTEFVFLTARGTPWKKDSLAQRVRRLREKIGLPDDVVLYGIRHQFGTQSVMNGVDIRSLAELLGHTSTRMTEHYVHLTGQTGHLHAAMRQAVAGSQGTETADRPPSGR